VRAVNVTRSKVRSAAVMLAPSVFHAGVPSPVSRARASVCDVIGTVMAPAWNTPGGVAGQVDDSGRQRRRHQGATRAERGLGERPLVVGAVPMAGGHAAQIPLQAQVLLGLVDAPRCCSQS
jgi:hypothetical protein